MAPLSSAEAYRLWAASWDDSASPIVSLEDRYLSPWLHDLWGKTFIDVGCGTGRWLSYAFQEGARCIGVDLSFEMLRQAALKPGLDGRVAAAEMTSLPLPDRVADVVLCALSLGHCRNALHALSSLLRVPKRDGQLIISDFHPDAIAKGWKRTFQHGPDTLEVESFPYSIEAVLELGDASGYRLEQLVELSFGPQEEETFRRAGRDDLWGRVENQPAVILISMRRQ
ncbi:MAG TPA: methyltransferase domain-containing protein [Bryobacteraceae bacterium]|jgi:ubiquinone/menaquinone biosynthesis C-methylase UbiE